MNGRYARQIAMPYVGEAGQKRLGEGTAAVVGCGALGSACAGYLARAGVGRIVLIDPDRVELSNLQRQSLYSMSDLGGLKAEAAARSLSAVNPEIELLPVAGRLDDGSAPELLSGAGVVLDCTDNLASRHAINRFCVRRGIPWIYAGVAGGEGMTMNILPGGPCFRCLAPEPAPAVEDTAANRGILSTTAALLAAVQGTEAMKILMHGPGHESVRRTLLYINLIDNCFEQRAVARLAGCEVCGGGQNGN